VSFDTGFGTSDQSFILFSAIDLLCDLGLASSTSSVTSPKISASFLFREYLTGARTCILQYQNQQGPDLGLDLRVLQK